MLLLKLLLLPLKLTAKLLIYSIGTIIILFFFVMTIPNGIFSGLIKVMEVLFFLCVDLPLYQCSLLLDLV